MVDTCMGHIVNSTIIYVKAVARDPLNDFPHEHFVVCEVLRIISKPNLQLPPSFLGQLLGRDTPSDLTGRIP
jgi:hypothetical protein